MEFASLPLHDNEDIILGYNHRGKTRARYTHGPGIDEPMAVEKKGETYFYHADGLGSITALTDRRQRVVESYSYDSFGDLKRKGHKVKQPYTFTGREWDREIGLYYYRARYYDPDVGRFHSVDPILGLLKATGDKERGNQLIWQLPRLIGNPQMLHPFSYVQNNAINFKDPYGLQQQPANPCASTDDCKCKARDFLRDCIVLVAFAAEFPLSISLGVCATLGPGFAPCAAAVAITSEVLAVPALAVCFGEFANKLQKCNR